MSLTFILNLHIYDNHTQTNANTLFDKKPTTVGQSVEILPRPQTPRSYDEYHIYCKNI